MHLSEVTSERIMGVDFGTTYSSAGLLVDNNVKLVIDQGDVAIPSVVYFPGRGAPIVGAEAKLRRGSDPAGSVHSIKRILGCRFDDPAVRRHDASAGYGIRRGERGQVLLSIRDEPMTCEQVVSTVLARLRDLAELRFGGRVTRMVCAVPAEATLPFRRSLELAARLARIEIVEMLPEPVAGAIAMGSHAAPDASRVLVCDFGGGTFDASLLIRDGAAFKPIANRGDDFLGGDDFDEALADAVASVVFQRSRFDMLADVVRRQRLLLRCESVKRILSSRREARLTMPDAYLDERQTRAIDAIIERTWIEPRWRPLIERATGVVERLLGAAGASPDQVDHIALIGGASKTPLFREAIRRMFPRKPIANNENADVAVVLGTILRSGVHAGVFTDTPTIGGAAA